MSQSKIQPIDQHTDIFQRVFWGKVRNREEYWIGSKERKQNLSQLLSDRVFNLAVTT